MKRIFVLKERWVLIGDVVSENDKTVHITDASVIRRWGTTKGLGEIALKGPTKNTLFDPCGECSFPTTSIIFSIRCKTN
jgi:hypothetical protein